jgi:hypothetical protein
MDMFVVKQARCIRWTWVKIRSGHDIQEFIELVQKGRFESDHQELRQSPVDGQSVDVEFVYFDNRETIALLKSCPLVENADVIPGGVELDEQQTNIAA